MADKVAKRTIVRQTTHPSDSRPNIPTAELESFARPPLALIEELRAENEGRRSEQQLGFFGPWLRN